MAILRQIYQAVVMCVAIHLAYQQNGMEEDGYFYYQKADYPKDCQDVLDQCTDTGSEASGVYWIKPEGYEQPFEVYCDHDTDNGGWTVFQRRKDGAVDFSREWEPYRHGFGFLNQEFWLGNDKLAYLTNQRTYRLRIDMNIGGQNQHAEYDKFRITDEKGKYEMVHLGSFSSSGISNQMSGQLNQTFSIFGYKSDSNNCALENAGGWWFDGSNCNLPNLNGIYSDNAPAGQRIQWEGNGNIVSYSEMKVKPVTT